MALKFNNNNVEKVIYNGVEVNKVIKDGIVVYEKYIPSWHTIATDISYSGSGSHTHDLSTLTGARSDVSTRITGRIYSSSSYLSGEVSYFTNVVISSESSGSEICSSINKTTGSGTSTYDNTGYCIGKLKTILVGYGYRIRQLTSVSSNINLTIVLDKVEQYF